jgi:CheY-like chemotaxis protein
MIASNRAFLNAQWAVNPILVIDDDDDFRGLVCDLLRKTGVAVLEASDCRRALGLLLSAQDVEPSLILLDLVMPGMSGWEFLAIVKSYIRLAAIPIVVVSGKSPPTEALRRATNDHVMKPIEPASFLATVGKFVSLPGPPVID